MAMLRAAHLAHPITPGSGRVLLVTYNNTLVTYLKYLAPAVATNITIETYGKFARGYLASVGKMPYSGGIASINQRESWVSAAVQRVSETYNPSNFFKRKVRFFLDELQWITGMGIESCDQYIQADRIGRKKPLTDSARRAVWKILDEYRRIRAENHVKYDWYDIASSVRTELAGDNRPRHYKHVIIDEGQDLSPESIRSLVATVPENGSVSFFGDYHQQIYGEGLSWRSCGLNIRSVQRFANNYRNTAEIARVAIAMSQMPHMTGDLNDLVEPIEPSAAGAPPTLVKCKSEQAELSLIQRQAAQFAKSGTVAVLARTWADARRACGSLRVRELAKDLTHWDVTPGIYCGAYHSAKGLEFDAVLMPFCNDQTVPDPEIVAAFGNDEAASREGRLLYVSATRARTDLIVSFTGTVTPLLPTSTDIWARVEL